MPRLYGCGICGGLAIRQRRMVAMGLGWGCVRCVWVLRGEMSLSRGAMGWVVVGGVRVRWMLGTMCVRVWDDPDVIGVLRSG